MNNPLQNETSLSLVETLEQALLHVWPSVETERHGSWALRFAHGYSGRANAASALCQNTELDQQVLQRIEAFYRARNLPAQLRLTPLVLGDGASVLRKAGFSLKDEAVSMIASLEPFRGTSVSSAVKLAGQADRAWLSGVTSLNDDASKRNPEALHAITSRMKPPAAFAEIKHRGACAGYALAVIHGGWAELGSIIIAPEARGQGLGRMIVTSLLQWAAGHGASKALLQVDVDNAAAISLYHSLGFGPCYRYSTWRKAM